LSVIKIFVNVLFHFPVTDCASHFVNPAKMARMNARRGKVFHGEVLIAKYLFFIFQVFEV